MQTEARIFLKLTSPDPPRGQEMTYCRITGGAISDGSNNRNRMHNRNAVVSMTTTTAVTLFNNRVYFRKSLFNKKFI